jgi:hypothetical protein
MRFRHNILTLDALQVLSRSQVTPGVVNVHGYGRYVKVYIHTYTNCSGNPKYRTDRS